MRTFKLPILATLVFVAILSSYREALANGGDFHIGTVSTGIPIVALFGFGGFVDVMMLFFLANWARFRRLQNRSGPSSWAESSQPGDEEVDNGTRGEGE